MTNMADLVIGIDLGTQGVRALACDLQGQVVAQASSAFPPAMLQSTPAGWFEQAPQVWRAAVLNTLSNLVDKLAEHATQVAALSVCGTSGTLCLVDVTGAPVRDAIMYSDSRATTQAAQAAAAWQALVPSVGYTVSGSFALPRLLWVRDQEPEVYACARWALSPADLVIGWLTGVWGISDWTNMLKTGYDTVALAWPQAQLDQVSLTPDILPQVQAPGAPVAYLTPKMADLIGLPKRTLVVSGATDGTAAQFASGAVGPGQWNTTIGTTLVLKGVSERLILDPAGRVYCHRHPDDGWLPGGASSTGADCLTQRFGVANLPALDATALTSSPTQLTIYPLTRRGERFPFVAPQAAGFELGTPASQAERYAAHLEGIGCIERLAYDTLAALGAPVGDAIYTTGGATRGSAFTQIRADLTGRAMRVSTVPEAAMGAAILAASAITGASVADTAARLVRIASETAPRAAYRAAYDAVYDRFCAACRERGYLS